MSRCNRLQPDFTSQFLTRSNLSLLRDVLHSAPISISSFILLGFREGTLRILYDNAFHQSAALFLASPLHVVAFICLPFSQGKFQHWFFDSGRVLDTLVSGREIPSCLFRFLSVSSTAATLRCHHHIFCATLLCHVIFVNRVSFWTPSSSLLCSREGVRFWVFGRASALRCFREVMRL
ncbi:hypothetical protein C8J56DRAFT_4714 [Mycena floridula]|nr:hypothetical protein C8J56DRAFT_4714 [Mycena floridula]